MNFVNLYALTSYDKVSNNKLEKFNKLPKSFSQNVNGATVPYSKMGVSFCANNMVPILNRDNELLKDSAENSTLNNIKTEYPRFANSQLRSELASVEDLRQIHQIDLEAFDGRYEIDSDFDLYKEDLDSQNITTYAIKNANNEIVAYYQLDPVKNGDLYVHSIAVRKDLRNSKQGLASIIEMQKSITEYALANSVQKVTLDVD